MTDYAGSGSYALTRIAQLEIEKNMVHRNSVALGDICITAAYLKWFREVFERERTEGTCQDLASNRYD
jgi:hypothetical protein